MTESNLARSIKARLLNMADGDNKKYYCCPIKLK